MDIFSKIEMMKIHADLLAENLMGIEKDGLRVARKGGISQAAHPKIFGCALTHPPQINVHVIVSGTPSSFGCECF